MINYKSILLNVLSKVHIDFLKFLNMFVYTATCNANPYLIVYVIYEIRNFHIHHYAIDHLCMCKILKGICDSKCLHLAFIFQAMQIPSPTVTIIHFEYLKD